MALQGCFDRREQLNSMKAEVGKGQARVCTTMHNSPHWEEQKTPDGWIFSVAVVPVT